eukprot:7842102-Alexandrium_andersonii.AAC.1
MPAAAFDSSHVGLVFAVSLDGQAFWARAVQFPSKEKMVYYCIEDGDEGETTLKDTIGALGWDHPDYNDEFEKELGATKTGLDGATKVG